MNQQNKLALLIVLLSSILSCTNAQNRILEGIPNNIANSRHAVAIFHKLNYNCVGSIVSAKLVLTVAHCVEYKENTHLLVKAAVTYLWLDEGKPQCVEDKIGHPNYNPKTGFMDLAVLKVVGSFQETETTHIIELCKEQIQPMEWMTIHGWGTCDVRSELPCPILHSKMVQIQQCRNAENLAGAILFAQHKEGSIDLRTGDSGAAGVFGEKLCAVAQRAMDHSPDIYIDITSPIARNFIERQIEENK